MGGFTLGGGVGPLAAREKRLNGNLYDRRELIVCSHKGRVLQRKLVGRIWTFRLPGLHFHDLPCDIGRGVVALASGYAGFGVSTQREQDAAWGLTMSLFGEQNVPMSGAHVSKFASLDGMTFNLARLVWRMAMLINLAAPVGRAVVNMVGGPPVVHRPNGVLQLANLTAINGNYISFKMGQGVYWDVQMWGLLYLACHANIRVDNAQVEWPEMVCSLVGVGTEGVPLVPMDYGYAECYYRMMAFCQFYGLGDLLEEFLVLSGMMMWTPNELNAIIPLKQISIGLPALQGYALIGSVFMA
jgi:hypothetical protein